MQPRPMADTSRPLLPSLRSCIGISCPPFDLALRARRSYERRYAPARASETCGECMGREGKLHGPAGSSSSRASSANHVVLHGPESSGGPGRYSDLAVDVLDVVIGGLG